MPSTGRCGRYARRTPRRSPAAMRPRWRVRRRRSRSSGATLLAAEAAADCAVAWRRAHEPTRAAGAERRSRRLASLCEGARTPALAATAAARATLTPRELEIARLAASGLANKEIAARLFLSHRTVENKLHACYAKLGAGGRADLVRALEHL